ncbi:hypothetical protein CRP_106 [Candidatus Carsonella ruddii PV]|uniref:Uncharacterized protein n=1 Tax=Carsonella ruddii (strain PV) TaxID=387662 RepID=Q05FN4_CARRP|nr:hypothetical protein [Candidatus Carsonella ruddii]BAF35137.1 hypothetical protein CRP_106 [Candidatus Carsonella ruddii PV]
MTFLKYRFNFLKKVEYLLLYFYTIKVISLANKLHSNLNRFHVEQITIFNFFKKNKKIFLKLDLIVNKKKCFYCKKFFLKEKIKKNFFLLFIKYKKKIKFYKGC